MRVLVAASMLSILTACGQQQEIEPPLPAAPELPAWASEYAGRSVSDVFPQGNTNCAGHVDKAEARGARTTISGWAWDRSAGRAYDRLISVGEDMIINGAGTTTTDRSDVVSNTNGLVTDPHVGFEIVSTMMSGRQRIAAIDLSTDTACWVGQIEY